MVSRPVNLDFMCELVRRVARSSLGLAPRLLTDVFKWPHDERDRCGSNEIVTRIFGEQFGGRDVVFVRQRAPKNLRDIRVVSCARCVQCTGKNSGRKGRFRSRERRHEFKVGARTAASTYHAFRNAADFARRKYTATRSASEPAIAAYRSRTGTGENRRRLAARHVERCCGNTPFPPALLPPPVHDDRIHAEILRKIYSDGFRGRRETSVRISVARSA